MSRAGIKVFAPATVANVACGYDILGIALEKPGDEVVVKLSDKPGLRITKITGAKGKLPYEVEKNTAGFSALKLLEYLGETKIGIEMEIHKKMPFGSGLGSSAASAVAGVFAVNEILKRPLSKRELLPFAIMGEELASGSKHADNVAPSLLGGFIMVIDHESLEVIRLPVMTGLYVTIIYPHVEVLTLNARKILSDTVSLINHKKQSTNLGCLIAGLYGSNLDLIRTSLNDVIIEPQRAKFIPHFYDMKDAALKEGVLGCSISGSGPSVFAISNNTVIAENAGKKMAEVLEKNGIKYDIFQSKINQEGAIKY